MIIKFWGVRGSIPCPGPKTIKYGGNTPCLEVLFKNPDRRIIIDAGSGIRELGNHIMEKDLQKGPMTIEIFLTHTHWDHIMGFPFFTPLYLPNTKIKIYGPVSPGDEPLEGVVGGLLTYRFFPIREKELASQVKYIGLKEGRFNLKDGITLTTKYLNHPILCLGYRFEYQKKILCTVYDTEPFRNVFCTDPNDSNYNVIMAVEGEQVAKEENTRVENFFKDADLIIYDAQYTQQEYDSSKSGWGHSSLEYAIAAAKRSGVKRMALFHHEPMRTDEEIDRLAETYCKKNREGDTEVFFAREGMQVEL